MGERVIVLPEARTVGDRQFSRDNRQAFRVRAARFVETVCLPAGCQNVVAPKSPKSMYRCGDLETNAQEVVKRFSNQGCDFAVTDKGWTRVNPDGTIELLQAAPKRFIDR